MPLEVIRRGFDWVNSKRMVNLLLTVDNTCPEVVEVEPARWIAIEVVPPANPMVGPTTYRLSKVRGSEDEARASNKQIYVGPGSNERPLGGHLLARWVDRPGRES